jgi:twinkle protein
MADILEVKRALARQAQSVAEYLLPQGRKEGSEWRVGSIGGERGKSLGVHLSGLKAGVWSDFSSGEGGDLLDLWCATKGLQLPEALTEARKWLGMESPQPYREPVRTYTRPPKPKCGIPQARVLDYLRDERNVSAAAIEAYKVGEAGDEIIFPFLLPDGTLALAKARKAAAGASPKPTAADCEPVLFGWQAIPASAREVVITEGEIDALSMFDYGRPAMSVPFGGGKGAKQQWIENDFERMERFEKIFIATDMDRPGDEAAEEIASRLGRHRCLRVKLPRKDANQCLVEGVSKSEIDACFDTAEQMDPAGLRRPTSYREDVVHLFWPKPEDHVGYRMPYGKLADKLLFRPAEATIWSGSSGAGKSQILSDCTVDWVKQGSRICLVSLEMKGAQTLKRMCKQTVGVDRPTEGAIDKALRWLDQGLILYEKVGKAGVEALLEIFDYARGKYGCDQFIIDSLMRLGIAGDDYNGQEGAIFRLVEWAIERNVHLHLVAHSRKGERDRGAPETEDIKGAMEIGANAFNIVTVWRNRKLEEEIKAAQDEATKSELAEKPGVILNIPKQRNGDFEGKIGLWFDQASYRYHSAYDRALWGREYLRFEGKEAA